MISLNTITIDIVYLCICTASRGLEARRGSVVRDYR